MPGVISKYLGPRGSVLGVPDHYVAGGLVAGSLIFYAVYPEVQRRLRPSPPKVTENNNLWRPSGTKPEAQPDESAAPAGPLEPSQKRSVLGRLPALNWEFVGQFMRLVKIMIPGLICRESGLLGAHTIFLLLRTFLSIYVAAMEGAIVKYIVRKDARNFAKMLLRWFSVALPATFINSMIRYLESKLALSFRSRLVEHSYKLYFENQTYYRISVLDGRLDSCAQRLTDDIETVANVVARLYSQITKPLFDLLLIGIALAELTISARANLLQGPALICCVVGLTGYILKVVSPKFGQLVAQEAEKKGHLRHVHARLIANSEEVAFYGGGRVELGQLRAAYRDLVRHMERTLTVKLWFVMLEQFLMKYVWSGAGMVVVSLPILLADVRGSHGSSGGGDGGVSDRTQYFTTAKNLLLSGSDAVERLMSSYKEVVELAGHTARVDTMFTVFGEAARGLYQKTQVAPKDTANQSLVLEFRDGQPVARGRVRDASPTGEIALRNVPIVTPNCDVVCASLSLSLRPGMHLLITGPNGCGKSSLFRILSGLWPVYSGELQLPTGALFYIPQRPYMVLGSLRDQVIYPDTVHDMKRKGLDDAHLSRILDTVHLGHIVRRDSYDAVQDWTDVLSGGEKQRMAMARLFYHRPRYALLDECTSAVSIDVESAIYQSAVDLGVTLLTITHRPSLWKFHTHVLQFDGAGSWEFSRLNTVQRLDLKHEKEQLLKQAPSEERDHRLRELCALLGEDPDD